MRASRSTIRLPALILVAFALTAGACGGDDDPGGGGSDSGRDAARGDGGGLDSSTRDGSAPGDGAPVEDSGGGMAEGGPTDDGATPMDDGATPMDDGATPTDDGGTPTGDGSTPTDDGGSPTDGGTPTDDGATPTDDGGTPAMDSGTTGGDSGPAPDSGPTLDAGPRDAGSGGCFTNADCPARTDYCETVACGGAGLCLARPEICSGIFDPVCGCDGLTYPNDCTRQRAGVGRASTGECPGMCGLRPPAMCCYEPADCGGRLNDCVLVDAEPICVAGGEGVCKGEPPAGRCWDDDDCDPRLGETCEEEIICPCGAACVRPDDPGFCRGRPVTCDAMPTIDGCCFDDADCGGRGRCYGEDCAAGTPGRCLAAPEAGRCWESADCILFPGGTGTCERAFVCGCGMSCGGRADVPGTCGFAFP